MLKRLFGICSAVIFAAFAASALAGGERVHSYTLKHSGELHLTTPADWQDEIKPGKNGWFPTIVFRPASGNAFQIMVTPVAPSVGDPTPMPSIDTIHASIKRGRDKAAPEAVEKNIAIQELRGANVNGYYFTATDKAPGNGPDDFRIMSHFEVVTGRVLLMVTAFYNDDSGKVLEHAIAMLKSAQFKPGNNDGAQDQGDASDASLRVGKVAAGYSLTVPASRLEVILHGSKLEQQPGGSTSPGYFYFDDNGRGAIISGWFEPADNFPGIKPFWKNEAGDPKDYKRGGLMNVKFENVGKWQVVAYEVRFPGANWGYANMRAERVQAGTWIDLHLSIPHRLSAAKAHAKLLDVLRSIEVREK